MVNLQCCVVDCPSDSRKNPSKYPFMKHVTFFPFPKDIRQKRKWISLVRRAELDEGSVSRYSVVCSRHFIYEKPTEEEPFPTLFPYNNYKKNRPRSSSVFHRTKRNTVVSADCLHAELAANATQSQTVGEMAIIASATQTLEEHEMDVSIDGCQIDETSNKHGDHTYSACTLESSTGKEEAAVQTDIKGEDMDNYSNRIQILEQQLRDHKTMQRKLMVENITCSDESVRSYTGMPSLRILHGFFSLLMSVTTFLNYWRGEKNTTHCHSEKTKPGPKRSLTQWEEFLLTLVKLRLGLPFKQLGDLFGISRITASRTFSTWVNCLFHICSVLLVWPSRQTVNLHMPASFRLKYPLTRVIIDCTEVFIKRPRNPSTQAATYSSYKSHNTFKALVGISPAGAFTFVSKFWSGNTSDRHITKECGILDLIEAGDSVMADRGFTIRDLLLEKDAYLNIPPFTRASGQGKGRKLSPNDIIKTKEIARLRIHVERAIRRIKEFRIFDGCIDFSLKPLADQILVILAVLCNLQGPLF